MSQLLKRTTIKIKVYKIAIKEIIFKITVILKTHHFLIIYIYYYPCSEVIYIYCFCMGEILSSDVLLCMPSHIILVR